MKNQEVSNIFREIANILEIKGENPFRVRAYERAARTIESLPEDIELLAKEERIRVIPGIGEDLEEKIKEIISKGKLQYLDDLKKGLPRGLMDILKIPGVGPKTAKVLYEKLGIKDIVMLERMAHAGRIRGIFGIKEKTEENILRGIEIVKRGRLRMDLKTALDAAGYFLEELKSLKHVKKIGFAGSLRRMKETVRDIDILIASENPENIMEKFTTLRGVKSVPAKGATKSSILTEEGIQVDVRVVRGSTYGASLMYFTGSKEHNIKLRKLAIEKGLKLSEYGIFKDERRLPAKTESDIYRTLGLAYIEPELREDRGEIEAAMKNVLPKLVKLGDIKGDLHTHSTWSDGGSSIEEIVKKAKGLGYEYVAITDHSQGLKIAGGLDGEKLDLKRKEIEALKKKYRGIKILFGAEVDINSDGKLDYPDYILKEMDIAIAAIHAGFRQSVENLTKRIVMACQNRYINIIAHPTGRLWGAREGYRLDFKEIFKACSDTGTALEINSFPQRLDLNDINCRMAKDSGVKLVVNTDAHIAEQLETMKFGVSVCRRGWIEKEDLLNTLPFEKLNLRKRS